ncbi:MAG TPA: type II toxin-antitoxin system VapC family toxin [Edaphobacter sp.]|uniref:PIN domain-containing protein n=1 Tax=Edaphobacter sp. TaxID=1934404 RepID=UPI002BD98691|nr:type II toxin-antitoxin system VapC family toxin [Edaphobacter sp.]HUZ95230.1 type II toxin-antitoxin system VapC family toxin [Edaphobacter sp.]
MIGLDTNIVVRYFAQDDPIESRKATEIIERRLTEDHPGFISLVTMVETVWVLDRIYGLSDKEIASAVERMLQADSFFIQNEQEVFTAMVALRSGQGSFADALIGALGAWAGCASTLTFDRRAARLKGFDLP